MAHQPRKADMVYNQLLQDITARRYVPDEPLLIRRIAQECEVSELPVRDAIRRLEREGYVKLSTNQSATVREFDFAYLAEIYKLRGLLEGYAARVSADHLSAQDLEQMRGVNEELGHAWRKREPERYSRLDEEFHMILYRAYPRPELVEAIRSLWSRWRTIRSIVDDRPAALTFNGCRDHAELLQLLARPKRNPDEIERAVRDHRFRVGFQRGYEISAGMTTPLDDIL